MNLTQKMQSILHTCQSKTKSLSLLVTGFSKVLIAHLSLSIFLDLFYGFPEWIKSVKGVL